MFLKALKADFFVTSGSEEKLSAAIAAGAKGGFNYREPQWWKQAIKESGGFDVIIDSAGGNLVDIYLKLVKPGGKIVFYGATAGMPESFDLFRLFWSQATVLGSTMANDREFEQMVNMVDDHQIKPVIDSIRPLDDIVSAFDEMKAGKQTGKLVIRMAH